MLWADTYIFTYRVTLLRYIINYKQLDYNEVKINNHPLQLKLSDLWILIQIYRLALCACYDDIQRRVFQNCTF
jgi:hypothetical protein